MGKGPALLSLQAFNLTLGGVGTHILNFSITFVQSHRFGQVDSLYTMVARVRHQHPPLRVHCHPIRGLKLPERPPARPKACQHRPAGAKNLHTIVATVSHDDGAPSAQRHTEGFQQLPRATPFGPKDKHHRAV